MPTVPDPPTGLVATGGNSSASVAFTAPGNNGGATITGYTVTSVPGNLTGTGSASPVTVSGLNNGTSYTFTATATNSVGTGAPSAPSNAVTPATVPQPPTNASAAPGNQRATVSFTGPTDNGGASISGYTVTATDTTNSLHGGQTVTGTTSPLTLTGLTNGDNYTFTVHATNSVGNSVESGASTTVTPHTTVPDAPTSLVPTAGVESVSVAFAAPANNGGSSITSYTATATDTIIPANGGQTVSGTASPLNFTGLTPGDAYTFTVRATSALGSSIESVPTAIAIPLEPTTGTSTPPPFSDCTAYTITKAINPAQLQDELSTAAGQTVMIALWDTQTGQGGGSVPSISNPATLWVSPSTISATVVENAITAHVPNPNYGQPQSVQDYLAVKAVVQGNYATTLTSTQIQTAIKNLILLVTALQNAGTPQA